MKVLVWGLGYVGTVTAAGLAKLGHSVIGVETNPAKVEALNRGQSAVHEPGLDDLVAETVAAGNLKAVTDGASHVPWADVSLVSVGTPSAPDGAANYEYLQRVAADIGRGLARATRYHVVVIRSTVFPGTTRNVFAPLVAKHSGKTLGSDFGLASNPEFLRETTAIADFQAPPYTTIGQLDERSGAVVADLYAGVAAPVHRVAIEEAELLKFANNALHALKIGFANEIGRLADAIGIDSHSVMNMVCADTKLNISPAYLRPGFAFGGSCLPKDLRALVANARRLSVQLPVLEAVLSSNKLQVEAAHVKLNALGARRVAVLGLAFKPHTDDLRESPMIALIHELWKDGVDVTAFDPGIVLSQMLGANRDYLERQLPQIERILCPSFAEAVRGVQAVVVGHKRPEFVEPLAALPPDVAVIDLVRIASDRAPAGLANYRGIAW